MRLFSTYRRAVRYHVVALVSVFLGACAHDFGDAPDGGPTGYPAGILVGGATVPQVGNFPSLEASDGARVSSVSDATLGLAATMEGDALITNADSDDGNVFLMVIIVSIPPPAQMLVQVTGQTPGTYFLNALIDLNMDGDWGDIGVNGEMEWAVQNFPVTIGPTPTTVIPLPFAFGWGNRLPTTTWMRLALTDVAINAGNWDGTGEFATGEVEDHFVMIPLSNQSTGGPCQGKPVPHMSCNGPYIFPDGVVNIPVRCRITNVGGTGDVSWRLAPLPGCNVTLAPVADLVKNNQPIGCPGGFIALNFIATRAAPLPCSWEFTVRGLDPPSYMTANTLVAGYTDSTGSFLLTGEGDEFTETWVEDITVVRADDGRSLTARVTMNEKSWEYAEGAVVDLGIMYPDGSLADQRVTLENGMVEAEFETKGEGIHMVRVLRVMGNHLDYHPEKDKTLMDIAVLP